MEKKKRKTHYRQVQTIYLAPGQDNSTLVEDYEYLGYQTKVKGETLQLFWGTKPKKTEKTEEQKKERRSKTERRLGRKFSRSDS